MLASGATLSQAIDSIRASLGVAARILPMSDDSVQTMLHTDEGVMHLQGYLVRRRCEPVVRGIEFQGAAAAAPAAGVIDTIRAADLVVIAPSNPLISIGPVLAIADIRTALRSRRGSVVAVCPIVGGKSLKGPTDKMMMQLGYEVTPAAIAGMYRDVSATLILDPADDGESAAVEAAGMKPVLLPSVMHALADKQRLAQAIMSRWAVAQ
jgi:LPPG:FO 2-phospho-L-lactate transferase